MSVTELRRRLLAQAFLFDDPATYAAGIEDALAAVEAANGRVETRRPA